MAVFVWDDSFVTGIDDVDQQHFYLVGLINKFGKLLVDNTLSDERVEAVFQELYDYTYYHFQEEESLMQKVGIDAHFLTEHIQVHCEFLEKVTVMHRQVSEANPESLKALLDFLIHWLVYHILGMDKSMSGQMESIKNGISPEQALKIATTDVHNATDALLSALNNLFKQVSDRNQELHLLNKTLEDKVEQRTRELKKANKHLKMLAVTDALTNLPNRRYAMSHLAILWDQAQEKGHPISCLMVDADNFKMVNDKHGHDAGDKVLVELSHVLQQTVRNDDIVCRLGGDEFLIICDNTDLSGCKHLAKLLCDAVNKLEVFFADNSSWKGSISIGVGSKDESIPTLESLIKMADQGVYLAKEVGKGCVMCLCE